MAESLVTVAEPDRHGVTTLRFESRRPANSITAQLVDQLLAETTQLADRSDVRVLVLRGAPNIFSGGADLHSLASMDEHGYRAFIESEFALFDAVERLPFLTLAAIEGPCLGNAAELALACDLRMAGESVRYGFPETRIGFQGPASRLIRHVGLTTAKYLLFAGEILTAYEARAAGLMTWVVPDTDLADRAMQEARRFAALPLIALQETKRNLAAAFPQAGEMMANEVRSSLRTFRTVDAVEGRAAFLAKRTAVFRGE